MLPRPATFLGSRAKGTVCTPPCAVQVRDPQDNPQSGHRYTGVHDDLVHEHLLVAAVASHGRLEGLRLPDADVEETAVQDEGDAH